MQKLLGIILILLGIFLALYLGVWIMFVGGIVNIINGIKANPVEAILIAKGLAKVILANLVGWASFLICFVFGGALLSD